MKDEPAFPQPAHIDPNNQMLVFASPGLTIRQHFASLAMQGILASENEECGYGRPTYMHPDGRETYVSGGKPSPQEPYVNFQILRTSEQNIARQSVLQADALIEALLL